MYADSEKRKSDANHTPDVDVAFFPRPSRCFAAGVRRNNHAFAGSKIIIGGHRNRRYNPIQIMDVKKLIGSFCYRVEAKPGGGFIARCSDASQPVIEGATRLEIEQKIKERISSEFASQFPQFKDVFDPHTVQHTYHVEAKPGGGFIVSSGDPAQGTIEASTREQLETLVASKFISHLMQKLPPDILQQFSTQIGGGDVQVTVNRKITFSRAGHASTTSSQPLDALLQSGKFAQTGDLLRPPSPATCNDDSSPVIRYEKTGFGTFFPLLLLVLAVIAITYFFIRYR